MSRYAKSEFVILVQHAFYRQFRKDRATEKVLKSGITNLKKRAVYVKEKAEGGHMLVARMWKI